MLKVLLLMAALIAILTISVTSTIPSVPATAANKWMEASTSKLLFTSEILLTGTDITNAKKSIFIAIYSNNILALMTKVVFYNLNYDERKFTGQALNLTGKTIW